jgi:D-serine deaminase-like pyridoxal phosphate-dependent protein
MYENFSTPAVVVELDILEKNIKKMIEENSQYKIIHRPHIKAHKCVQLAKMQLEMGAKGITCAKLGEAEVMADGGIKDILLAFPIIGKDKLDRYGELTNRCTMRTIINSIEGAQGLSNLGIKLNKRLEVLIELDSGIGRSNIRPMEDALNFAKKAGTLQGIKIVGLLYYGGMIYGLQDEKEFIQATIQERDDLVKTAELLELHNFEMKILSGGSSFSAKWPRYLEGVTEVRPGNYVFNDGHQLYAGLIGHEDCSLRVISTVVTVLDEYRAVIDAGSKTLSSDTFDRATGFGYIIGREDITIHKLNEEHGYLRSDKPIGLNVGDRVTIIPNHTCVIPNLFDEIYGLRGGKLDCMLTIDARGKVS